MGCKFFCRGIVKNRKKRGGKIRSSTRILCTSKKGGLTKQPGKKIRGGKAGRPKKKVPSSKKSGIKGFTTVLNRTGEILRKKEVPEKGEGLSNHIRVEKGEMRWVKGTQEQKKIAKNA